jgi:acyl-CoA dehydrogenase
MYNAQEQLHSFLRNFPNRPVAFFLRRFVFPRGRTYSSPSDELGRQVVDIITRTGEARERLSEQAYTTIEPGNPLGLLQEALQLSETLAPLELKLRQARKEGLVEAEYLGHQIEEAERAEVVSKSEADELRNFHEKVEQMMAVDDFAADEIGRNPVSGKTTSETTVKKAAVKNPSKKPAKKAEKKKKIVKKKKVSEQKPA